MITELNKADNEIITTLSSKYDKALSKINERRTFWKSTTRELIYTTLNNIKAASSLKELYTQQVIDCENLEAVNIGFNQTSSGIALKEGSNISVATKYGGYLCFAQSYNGNIYVFVMYPYVEEYVGQLENKLLATHEPSDFNIELIIGYFEKFINEMVDWEIEDRNPIGYKTSKIGLQTGDTA